MGSGEGLITGGVRESSISACRASQLAQSLGQRIEHSAAGTAELDYRDAAGENCRLVWADALYEARLDRLARRFSLQGLGFCAGSGAVDRAALQYT